LAAASETGISVRPPTPTSCEVKPTEEITSVALGLAVIVNLPEEFVEVPLEVPFIVTLAPDIGVLSETTVPETETSCAIAVIEKKRRKKAASFLEAVKLARLAAIVEKFIFLEFRLK
jgi:hypothetical protein